ncbi:MAG TPA: hypothetical protein VGM54_18440 [Chthoniobacter sp.]
MQSVPKLIRQMREALVEGRDAPLESLAADYARVCEEAIQRLESCAAMLEKGSDYQALQLAETEPALLDLIGSLSFAESPQWIAYCETNHLPSPQRFDGKAVQALDTLYAKGISVSHPLYKDYRAAVTSRDDIKALHIIRSIVRLNPDDGNAKAELTRIENKLYQLKLQELRVALNERDESAVLADVAELERLATPSKLAELPEYARAGEIRREVARREAMATADRLVDSLDEERQAQAWRMVGDILARLRSLQVEHGFVLQEKQAAKCAEMQQYFDVQRGAAEETARFEHALATIGGLAETFDRRLVTRATLTFEEAQNLNSEFSLRWKDVEKFQRPVPEVYLQRVRSTAGSLRGELARLQRARRLRIVGAAAVAVLLIAAGVTYAIITLRVQEYSNQLGALRDGGQVEAAEKMAADLRTEHAFLAGRPKLASRLNEVEHWARAERASQADIDQRLSELEAKAKAGLDKADPFELATKIESTGQLIDALATDLKPAPTARLLVLRNQFDAYVAVLRDKYNADAETAIAALETAAGAQLNYDQPKETVARGVAEIDAKLKAIEAREKPPVAALEMPAPQQARVASLRKRVDLFRSELDTLAKVHEGLLQSTNLESYLQALAGYKDSRLAQAHEVNDARKLLAGFPKVEDLLAGLLMPDDPTAWAAAKVDVTGDALMPDTVFPAEITRLIGLREDIYLANIWEVSLVDFRHKNEHRDLYARGDLKREGPNTVGDDQITRWIGSIYDPESRNELPAFMPNTTISLQRGPSGSTGDGEVTSTKLSAVSSCLNHLELNRLTDSAGLKYERPLLRVFDDVVHDKSAHPIFKAYMFQQLGAVLKIRPYAWGLEYCPSLRDDLVAVDRLCDNGALRSQDWLVQRKRDQLDPKLSAFFSGLEQRNYFAEAQIHREVVRAVLKAGLQYGGFIDDTGRARLLGDARSAKLLWALAPDAPKLVQYVPPIENSKTPAVSPKSPAAPFSPVFFVPLDRAALTRAITRQLPGEPGAPPKLPLIPFLDTP